MLIIYSGSTFTYREEDLSVKGLKALAKIVWKEGSQIISTKRKAQAVLSDGKIIHWLPLEEHHSGAI